MGHRILIVEDHNDTRMALARLFRRKGWEVVEAETVADALAKLVPPPKCAIVDLMLPDGSGEDVIRTIKDSSLPTCVAVCTGVDDHDRLDAVQSLCPNSLLRKPIDVKDVFRVCDGMEGG